MFEELFSHSGLSLDRLRSFLEMAEAGSIAKAAPGDVNRQSLISRQIRELEEFFGSELTVRRGKTLALSPAGKRLAVLIREQFRDLLEFQQEQHQLMKSVSIGAGASILEWLVIPAVAGVKAALGPVALALSSERSRDVVDGVRDGRLDFGIVREDAIPEALLRLPVRQVSFHLCVSKSLLGRRPASDLDKPAFWKELPFAANSGGGQLDRTFRQAMAEACGNFRPAFECSSLVQVRELVKQGACAGVLASVGSKGLEEHDVIVRQFAPLKGYGRALALHWNERQMRRRGIDERSIKQLAKALQGR